MSNESAVCKTPLILVTGGAGYIGSHMTRMLRQSGYEVVVFDNLSRGHRDAVSDAVFVEGDLLDNAAVASLFADYPFDAVLHFAAFAYVGESMSTPAMYYRNNVLGSLNLIDAARHHGVDKFVFSSTCATYGVKTQMPITEDMLQSPINPYGQSKLMVEQILSDHASAYEFNSMCLRYFNAAGCDPSGELRERHDPETHLIPLVLEEARRVLSGGQPADTSLRVFGDDFDTVDGSCVRDYIHVNDLCSAHLAAVARLLDGRLQGFNACNLGNGKGFSVKQVIETASEVTGVDIQYSVVERRAGDPGILIGSAEKAAGLLDWKPSFTELREIIASAWKTMI